MNPTRPAVKDLDDRSASVSSEPASSNRRTVGAVPAIVPIVVLGAVLRFATLGLQSYWDDEGFTVGLMREGFGGLLRGVWRTESAPPTYYILAWGWAKIFGLSEPGLRSLSAVFGTLTIVAVYWAILEMGYRRGALLGATAVAVNPILIWYSQEARAYALFTFATALTLVFFVRLLVGDASARARWGWAAAACLSLVSHYFSLFLLLPQVGLLLRRAGPRKLAAQLATVAAVGLVLLPLALHQRGKEFGFTGNPILRRVAQVPEQLLVGFGVWSDPLGKLAAFVCALAAAIGVVLALRHAGRSSALLAVSGVAAFAAVASIALSVVHLGLDYVATRYFVGVLVAAALVVGAGWGLGRYGILTATVYTVVALGVDIAVITTPAFQREDLRGAAHSIAKPCLARAVVVSPSSRLDAYLPKLEEMPTSGVRVHEVDLVAMPVKAAGRHEVVPRALRSVTPAPGFRLASRDNADRFTTVRFRSSQLRLVRPSALARSRIGPWSLDRVTVFWEPCGTGAA